MDEQEIKQRWTRSYAMVGLRGRMQYAPTSDIIFRTVFSRSLVEAQLTARINARIGTTERR